MLDEEPERERNHDGHVARRAARRGDELLEQRAEAVARRGCGVHGGNNTMGAPFNAMGGGVYALEWDASSDGHFAAWYWPHGGEPDELRSRASESSGSAAAAASRALDVDAATVDTAEWGKPYAYFQLGDATCPTTHFANMSISFTLTFCGDWSTYDKAWGCADKVAQRPGVR